MRAATFTLSFINLLPVIVFVALLLFIPQAEAARTKPPLSNDPFPNPSDRLFDKKGKSTSCEELHDFIGQTKIHTELGEEASHNDIDILDIAFPLKTAPEFYRFKTLHFLMTCYRNHIQKWLTSYGFEPPPAVNGYKSGKLPEQGNTEFRQYLNDHDPLLVISLAQLIHLVNHNKATISEQEMAYFHLCSMWINEVLFPPGINPIDWEVEYETTLKGLNHPQALIISEDLYSSTTKIELIKSAVSLPNDIYKYVLKYLMLNKLQESSTDDNGSVAVLKMLTAWNAIGELRDADMHFSELEKSEDPFLRSHVQFTLKAALFGSFLQDQERTLVAYWLQLSEITKERSDNWKSILEEPYQELQLVSATTFKSGLRTTADKKNKSRKAITTSAESPPDSQDDNDVADSWSQLDAWMETNDKCSALRAEIEKNNYSFTMREVCFPDREPPSFFRPKTLHGLINNLIDHLQDILEEYGFLPAPQADGYQGGLLPEGTEEDFTKEVIGYIEDVDPVLMPSLIHLIHLARQEKSSLNGMELTYLDLRLTYINDVIIPDGMNKFDWGSMYQNLLKDRQEWRMDRISFPKAEHVFDLDSEIEALPEKMHAPFIQQYLNNRSYQPELKMMTIWNTATDLFNNEMILDFSNTTTEPLQAQHISFSIQAAMAGSYLTYRKRLLLSYWLALFEIQNEKKGNLPDIWRTMVLEYVPHGVEQPPHQADVSPLSSIHSSSQKQPTKASFKKTPSGGKKTRSAKIKKYRSNRPKQQLHPQLTLKLTTHKLSKAIQPLPPKNPSNAVSVQQELPEFIPLQMNALPPSSPRLKIQ